MFVEESEDISTAKSRVLEVFAEFDDDEIKAMEQWIGSKEFKKDLQNKKSMQQSEEVLNKIADVIKDLVPSEAEMASEKIVFPVVGDASDCNKVNSRHVDEFLYDDDEVTELVKDGKLSRHYCLDCNSQNIHELTFISHSKSKMQLQFIFKVLLPKDLECKQILDVGSRFGGVLYGAYYFTNASKIIGIELNEECCGIQEKVIAQFKMDKNRILVVNSDVMNKGDIVKKSDVCIINCLDFFVSVEEHKRLWYFFKEHLTQGSYVVLDRSIADTLQPLDMFDEFGDWLNVCKPFQLENEILFDVADLRELFLYTVN